MNSSRTVTNADGSIVTITVYDHVSHYPWGLIFLALLALVFIGWGLYLLLRKEKPR